MDAKTIYKALKPQLDHLNPSEKKNLIRLIRASRAKRISCNHRRIFSLSKAKDNLKKFCLQEMERERLEQHA